MQKRFFNVCAMLVVAAGLVAFTGCSNSDDVVTPGGGSATGGGADIDVMNSNPATGDATGVNNISGPTVVVQSAPDTLNSTAVTRVTVTATIAGYQRQVLVYFETANGNLAAVTYSWGLTSLIENIVHCPQVGGCVGVTVDMPNKTVFFLNTILDDTDLFTPTPTKTATLSLGAIQYP